MVPPRRIRDYWGFSGSVAHEDISAAAVISNAHEAVLFHRSLGASFLLNKDFLNTVFLRSVRCRLRHCICSRHFREL